MGALVWPLILLNICIPLLFLSRSFSSAQRSMIRCRAPNLLQCEMYFMLTWDNDNDEDMGEDMWPTMSHCQVDHPPIARRPQIILQKRNPTNQIQQMWKLYFTQCIQLLFWNLSHQEPWMVNLFKVETKCPVKSWIRLGSSSSPFNRQISRVIDCTGWATFS